MGRFTRASLLAMGLSISLAGALGCGSTPPTGTGGAGGTGGQGGQGGEGAMGGGGQGGGTGCEMASKPCYDGDPGTAGVGECKEGTSTCSNGVWSACEGQVLPQAEVCDGLDNDCNGNVDEDLAEVTCGVGKCQVTVPGCVDGVAPECVPLPPAMVEVCDNEDDDCDGVVDNGGDCVPCADGATEECYTGAAGTQGVGACKAGTRSCVMGTWGACEGEVLPSTEACNGTDDDCDGNTDEDLGQTTCGSGECFATVEACVGGVPQQCVPGQPKAETCNGLDDDCNALIDDGLGTISCGLGECTNTVPACSGGMPGMCVPKQPTTEVCDGKDNDCDGNIDDGNPGGGGACMTGQPGACAAGTYACTGGSLQCMQTIQPKNETCNGQDDDCDGTIDDGNPGGGAACTTGKVGICAQGTTTCQNGAIACIQNSQPTTEACDGLDNNCNGATDEGNPGGGVSCQTGKPGVCAAGTTLCQNGTIQCNQTNQPSVEVCNGLDDNCNGTVDEGNPGSGGVCSTGLPGVCGPGTYQCQNGGLVCVGTNMPTTEVCDGVDNDCDGMIDDGNPGGGGACSTGQQGVCAAGVTTCANGMLSCVPTNMPSAEICDNKDNDCDGVIDDGNPGGGSACTTGQPGECSAGTYQCQGGMLPCVANKSPTAEICDGKDNDCNGVVDNGNPGGGGACTTGQPGACSAGTYKCQGGALVCVANNMPSAEVCDGIDNDCDGVVDDQPTGVGAACGSAYAAPCTNNVTMCVNGALICGVSNVFEETFATATAGNGWNGWTLDTEWQIGTATVSSGHDGYNPDPGNDHTPTADNKLAGVVIGGNASIAATHPMYYLTSPIINTAGGGAIVLDFWRWLNTDWWPWMSNSIEVYNGSSWVVIWQVPSASSTNGFSEAAWTNITHDLSAYKNANMRVRFGFMINQVDSSSWLVSSWNLDDVVVRRCY